MKHLSSVNYNHPRVKKMIEAINKTVEMIGTPTIYDNSKIACKVEDTHIIHHKKYRVKAYKRRAKSINQTQTWECILKPNYGTTKDIPPLDALRPGAIVIVLDPRR